MNAVLELAKQLVACPSISPEDGGCQEIIAARLKQMGFHTEAMPFGNVANLWATHGSGSPLLVFAGHTDVVPVGSLQEWHSDPFEPTIRDGFLYGRGAADMKSSLAAMVIAAEGYLKSQPYHLGTLGFLITSDEEDIAVDGTVKVIETLQARNQEIDYCVVGEPSCTKRLGDTIRVGRRGSLNGKLTLTGELGHVAYPDETPNAVHEVSKILADLVSREWDAGNEYFRETTFQVSNIQAGTGAENVIPEKVEVAFNFRFNTLQTADGLKQAVEEAFEGIDKRASANFQWRLSGHPFLSSQGQLTDAVVDAVEQVTQLKPEKSTSGGTSDARFIVPTGTETVELGPLNATIHKINERVAIEDLQPLANIYQKTIETVFGNAS